MTNRINGSFDFRDADQNLVKKQIAELENAISFEKENIEICLTNSEMSGVCLDLGCGSGTSTRIISRSPFIVIWLGVAC